MMWTKLGDEFPEAARDLSDAAHRTHVEALCWSNRRGLDLRIPKRDLRRFAETEDPDTVAKELVAATPPWWRDDGDAWFIGLRFPDWQLESVVVDRRREATAVRVRRHRMHKADDHSLCQQQTCNALRDALRNALPGTGRDGTGQEQLGDAQTYEGGAVPWDDGEATA